MKDNLAYKTDLETGTDNFCRLGAQVILPKPTQVEPGQLWLSDKDFKYNQGYDGEVLYLTKSKEPDEPWVCILFQEWEFGGYFRELNEKEIKLMKYIGHIKDLRRRSK